MLIDRDKAIEAIEVKEANEFGNYREYNVAFNDGLRSAVFALEELPSAERKGKWIRTYLDHEAMGIRPSILYCSECQQCIAYSTNYCPNCGARMVSE